MDTRPSAAGAPTGHDYATSFTVQQSADEVYAAVLNVAAWWTGEIEGRADELGGEFAYRHLPQHYSLQRVIELDPGRRVVWQVVDSRLAFVSEPSEWTGSRIVFDIAPGTDPAGTELRFTHHGLMPGVECFEACSTAWRHYVNGSLHSLITTGHGLPDPW